MKVVDTTFIISLLRNDSRALEKAGELDEEGGAATTVVNVFEAAFGVYSSLTRTEERLEALGRVLSNLEILSLDCRAAIKAAEISATLEKRGVGLDPFDALVAAITLANGAESLVTRNTSHFQGIRGLRLEEH